MSGPPITRRRFFGDWDHVRYLYGKALYWLVCNRRSRSGVFASRIPPLLEKLPGALQSVPGREFAALAAELDSDWKTAALHRRRIVAMIIRLRDLALTEEPLAQRAILRDYSPAKLSDAYDLLARCYRQRGNLAQAAVVLEQSRQHCSAHGIPFLGAPLSVELQQALLRKRNLPLGREWMRRLERIVHTYGKRAFRENEIRAAIVRRQLS